jgi:2-oxoglutarate ferredoxin oxidoreductase subunit delta
MAKIKIKKEKCKACLLCIAVCPKGLIEIDNSLNKHGVRPVKHKKGLECIGCALCAIVCPDACIEVWK